MKKSLLWFTAAAVLIVVFGTIFVGLQQLQRQQANDPQIQIAQDAATHLNSGSAPQNIAQGRIDIGQSLAPFVIIYDLNGKVVSGSGYLNGSVPSIPKGVLTASQSLEFNAITWEPQDNLRFASVSVKANRYYVTSGRSLKQVESNIQTSLWLCLFGLAVAEAGLAVGYLLTRPQGRK